MQRRFTVMPKGSDYIQSNFQLSDQHIADTESAYKFVHAVERLYRAQFRDDRIEGSVLGNYTGVSCIIFGIDCINNIYDLYWKNHTRVWKDKLNVVKYSYPITVSICEVLDDLYDIRNNLINMM